MRDKLISSVAGAAFSFAAIGFAFAADMAVKSARPLPPPAAVYNWTGWYAGLNAGAGLANNAGINNSASCSNSSLPAAFCAAFAAGIPGQFAFDAHPSGFIGGGQIGY